MEGGPADDDPLLPRCLAAIAAGQRPARAHHLPHRKGWARAGGASAPDFAMKLLPAEYVSFRPLNLASDEASFVLVRVDQCWEALQALQALMQGPRGVARLQCNAGRHK